MAEKTATVQAQPPLARLLNSGEEISILVVEDSPVQAETLRRMLVKHDFSVSVARNGKEGLAMVRETKPTIVITDVLMPEMNGYDLCRRIKEEERISDIPVILLTTLSEPENILKGLECGANNFVTKPYEEKTILSRIGYVLANRYLRSVARTDFGIEILFGQKKYLITSDRLQILDLLLSSYETAISKNQELTERNMELEVHYGISSAISLMTDTDGLFGRILEVITGSGIFTVLRKGAIFLVEGETLRLGSHLEVPPCMSDGNSCISFGKCLCGLAAQTGELLVSADSQQDGRHIVLGPGTEPHGHFIVPLKSKSVVLGVLCLYTPLGIVLDDHKAKTLALVGHQLGMAIERMYAHEEIRRLNEELTVKVEETTRQLLEAQEELVRKEKLSVLGQLSGSVGHELRNPLGVMSNAVYFLKMVHADADASTKEYLEIIKKEIDKSLRFITDLLDFARTKPPRRALISAAEVVQQSLEHYTIPENVSVMVDLPAGLPRLNVDPSQLGQVLTNFITNGVQAMPNGGELRVAARLVGAGLVPAHEQEGQPQGAPRQNCIEISVTDSGEGITPENMKKLFQPLFTTKAKGIGLGLVVCKNLVEANGGRIEVESDLVKGTTFSVVLPVDEIEAP